MKKRTNVLTTLTALLLAICLIGILGCEQPGPVTGVSLPDTAQVIPGGTVTLTATITPDNAANKAVTWTITEVAGVTISQSGVVSAEASVPNDTTVTVTVTTADGGFTDTCVVTVTNDIDPINAQWSFVSPGSALTSLKADTELTADIDIPVDNGEGASFKLLSGAKLKYVPGTVLPIGEFEDILLSPNYIQISKSSSSVYRVGTITTTGACDVSVYYSSANSTDQTSRSITLNVGGSSVANGTSNLSTLGTTTAGVLTYAASGAATVDIEASGVKIWGISASNGLAAGPEAVAVTGVTLPETETVADGATVTLTAAVEPETATNKTVTWASDNTAAATVSTAGLVTGVNPGTANITVTTNDGSFTDTCVVTVTEVVLTGISLPETDTVGISSTKGLSVTFTPNNATYKGIAWASSNESVATVDQTGLVTGVADGTAVITATSSQYSTITASCTVTVGAGIVEPEETIYSLDIASVSGTAYTVDTLVNDIFYGTNKVKSESLKLTTYEGVDTTFVLPAKQVSLTGGKVALAEGVCSNGIKFTTTGSADIVVYIALKSDKAGVSLSILDSAGAAATATNITKEGTALETMPVGSISLIEKVTLTLSTAGTYYLGGSGGGLYVYGLSVEF